MSEKQPTNLEALNIFLGEIFEKRVQEKFPWVDLMDEEKSTIYFKLWCNGVAAGLELNRAITYLKEGEAL